MNRSGNRLDETDATVSLTSYHASQYALDVAFQDFGVVSNLGISLVGLRHGFIRV